MSPDYTLYNDELSYDRFHVNADRIYQVGLEGETSRSGYSGVQYLPSDGCRPGAEIPEIESATRVAPYFGRPAVKYEDKVLTEEKVFYADSNFFEFFSFVLKEGDIKKA